MKSGVAAGRFALAVSGVVVILGIGECTVRVAGIAPERYRRPRYVENADKTAAIDAYPTNPRGYFDVDLRDRGATSRLAALGLPDADKLAARTPFAVEIHYNRHRCRDVDPGPKASGVTRVLVLGDSFTEGQGVREEDTFPRKLEHALRAKGRAVEVLNCGRRGRDFPALYNAFDELTEAYQPDIVLYAMVLNDAVQSPEFHARQPFLNDWILDRRRTLAEDDSGGVSGLRLWAIARDRLDARRVAAATTRWYVEMYGPENQAGWDETRGYLERMRDRMNAGGGRLIVALLPLLVERRGAYPFAGPASEIRRACADANIAFVDLADSVATDAPDTLWVHAVDMHPNERAHARFADGLRAAVESADRR